MLESFGPLYFPRMLKKQLLLPPLFCFGMALVSGPVSALGFRASSPSAALGQPLDFNVALSVDAGESLASECVRAEVTVGDRVLPKQAVNTTIDGLNSPSPKVRVQSNT